MVVQYSRLEFQKCAAAAANAAPTLMLLLLQARQGKNSQYSFTKILKAEKSQYVFDVPHTTVAVHST